MKTAHDPEGQGRDRTGNLAAAFTLVEVMIAVSLLGIVTVTTLTGIASSQFAIQSARENARATQIMLEKIETIRLYTWDQLNLPGFIPATFTESYDPEGAPEGLVYNGSLTIGPAALGSSYSNELRTITVTLSWNTGSLQRQRQMSTYFSRYGIQDYIY